MAEVIDLISDDSDQSSQLHESGNKQGAGNARPSSDKAAGTSAARKSQSQSVRKANKRIETAPAQGRLAGDSKHDPVDLTGKQKARDRAPSNERDHSAPSAGPCTNTASSFERLDSRGSTKSPHASSTAGQKRLSTTSPSGSRSHKKPKKHPSTLPTGGLPAKARSLGDLLASTTFPYEDLTRDDEFDRPQSGANENRSPHRSGSARPLSPKVGTSIPTLPAENQSGASPARLKEYARRKRAVPPDNPKERPPTVFESPPMSPESKLQAASNQSALPVNRQAQQERAREAMQSPAHEDEGLVGLAAAEDEVSTTNTLLENGRRESTSPKAATVEGQIGRSADMANSDILSVAHGIDARVQADASEQAKQAAEHRPANQSANSLSKVQSLVRARSELRAEASGPRRQNVVAGSTALEGGVERHVGQYIQELREDNEHWTRIELQRARQSIRPRVQPRPEAASVFSNLNPISLRPLVKKSVPHGAAKLIVELHRKTTKPAKVPYVAECTPYDTTDTVEVPRYSHYVSISHSLLASNVTSLQHWPYFGDDFEMSEATTLKKEYYIDVDNRERKLLRLGQAENFGPYADDLLHDVGCEWSDVLRFLLEAKPELGENPNAHKALQERGTFISEDYSADDVRWAELLRKLPKSSPEKIGKAAVLCDQFQRIAKFALWHVARRTDFTMKLVTEPSKVESDDVLTCRICMRYGCPYHGQIRGQMEDVQDTGTERKVFETDIVLPQTVNFRSRVRFPEKVDCEPPRSDTRRPLDYWERGAFGNLKWTAQERGPFYPCDHPGTTCEGANCSCFNERIACEKSCSCAPGCKRKWQGCSCRSGSRSSKAKPVCWEDDRCACFQKSRECDPDLCGECGVAEVVDPVHRHDDRILQGRCRMSGIQRGVYKHTILGDSGVHGLGLYACEQISPGDFVGEYKGETITKEEGERRGAVYDLQKLSYLFSLNLDQEIDGTYFGNKTRFINHVSGAKSNLRPLIIMVNNVFRIAMYARRHIQAGDELFFDYGPSFPKDQLDVKSAKSATKSATKSAPRVRNANLVFYDVELSKDQTTGNTRATKTVTGSGSDDKDGDHGSAGEGGGIEQTTVVARSQRASTREKQRRARRAAEDWECKESSSSEMDTADSDSE